jgi:hypothetical protein
MAAAQPAMHTQEYRPEFLCRSLATACWVTLLSLAAPARSVVASWYEEIGAHNFDAPEFDEQVGHFTQVIRRSSKHLGCAMAICQGRSTEG